MKTNRVAITGIGAICGLGHNTSEIWQKVTSGISGISHLENQDPTGWPVTFGGEIKDFHLSPELLNPKDHDRYDLLNHYALHAADEAIRNAQIMNSSYSKHRMGIILGTGLGGFHHIESQHQNFLNKGPRRVSPFFIPSVIPNMPEGLISIKWGLKGISLAVASACASSAHAIGLAATEIMLGRQDVMITGGTEGVITGFTIAGFSSMKALSKNNQHPRQASRPFDQHRNGFVMGEGAGILVLENFDSAIQRGADILAEVVGFGSSSDAFHVTSPHPDGEGAAFCMQQTLKMAQVQPEHIDYINAHGTSTVLGDIAETRAIKKVFQDHAYDLAVSSTKSMTGHLLGAAGGLESIFCVLALQTGMIPPTINLDQADPECDLYYVPHTSEKREITFALNNSFGFGGTNSSTLFKKVG